MVFMVTKNQKPSVVGMVTKKKLMVSVVGMVTKKFLMVSVVGMVKKQIFDGFGCWYGYKKKF